ncbi:glycosyltransferase family 4 protein [Bacteroides fragilis]|uniref:glycosyltransferase family 4 protein n=1 Tax=Bacteroides fragilis TaxID=817 RepID=UPI001C70482E|nr:glycosyltransferase family 4 protein [Bacteroides fragilis]MBW9276415.1 glycosyltransferase family 4 protein [Bacteroides fragilis]
MKALFLIFHGFEEANGISKKIRYQVKALKECGIDVRTCWLDDDHNHKRRMVDNQVLQDYGNGIRGKILKRTGLKCIVDYVKSNNIQIVYARSDHNTTPFLIYMFWQLKRTGVKTVMEIPTYPYDQEYKGLPWGYQRVLLADKCLRRLLAKQIHKIVTFSDHKTIFGRPTIRISNGIDFDAIPIKQATTPSPKELNLIAVATIHPWHGFDRAIRGMIQYIQNEHKQEVRLHIVGQGVPSVMDEYQELVKNNALEPYVIFHGPLFGESLDKVFNECQIGIGSLARHRSGITYLRSLKNREYAARGIPFIYSEIDEDFESMPYIMKIPADESFLDIHRIIKFYDSIKEMQPSDIRASISNKLSWKVQMKHVIEEL